MRNLGRGGFLDSKAPILGSQLSDVLTARDRTSDTRTYQLLLENGNTLITEASDVIVTEEAP